MLKSDDAEPEGVGPDRLPLWSRESDNANTPIAISSLLIGGPYNGTGAAGLAEPPADLRVPSRRAPRTNSRARRRSCRSWRGGRIAAPRPTTTSRRCSAFYKRGRAAGNFDDGIRAALERVLVSPDFLFRIEADPAGAAPGAVYRISDVELASRLSFALVEQHSGRHASRPGDPRKIA